MTYRDALTWLYGTQLHGIKLGLENTRRLLEAIGFRNEPRIIHVAGTNGKGSVCAMIDSIARAQGLRTGLFTSPHLVTFRERVQIDGEMIGEQAVAEVLTMFRDLVTGWETHPTFFELTTGLALAHFQRMGVEVIALETGMGGRLDATNAVTPVACAITRIDLDHEKWLGSTILEIAAEKAGIIKARVPVVSAIQHGGAARVLREAATRENAPIFFVDEPLRGVEINLRGSHQACNAALAVAALQAAQIEIDPVAIRSGLKDVAWPGRFQVFEQTSRIRGSVVLDGAHNAAAAERLALTWREQFGTEKAAIILGVLNDKDVRGICAALLAIASSVITTSVLSARATPSRALERVIRELDSDVPCSAAPNLATALEWRSAEPQRTLITGSLFLVGEALALLGEGNSTCEESAQ